MSRPPTKRPRKSWLFRLARLGLRLGVVALVLGAVGLAVLGVSYKRYVLDDPGEHVSREAVLGIISQESPVLYGDGETRIGVFFSREHREYVAYGDIPQAWVQAIVAAEDQRYFEHPGVDAVGISRAMVQNLQAGRLVSGGSSLTQQTAKNLYYRPDRSLRSKWEELVNALRLEAHHSKEEILEYYANQFHVSANGRGLGIAARYFFDKDVHELTTLECAFIAGMVKAPARYNPFVGSTEERRDKARKAAKDRTAYVLGRMVVTGALSQAEHDRLVAQEIPFKKGTFRYDTSVLVDEVAARLEQAPFPELFEELGIDNPSTAGISVVTTLDLDAQREATWALRHHLSEVGPLLEKQGVEALFLAADKAPGDNPDKVLLRHEFSAATVVSATPGKAPAVALDLGGPTCTLDEEALLRMATVLVQAKTGEKWRTAKAADVTELVGALKPGRVVWVSLREAGRCDLELRPELQGGVMLLEQGQIRAMVGGSDNRNFNRAITARRQLGSTWKPLVYAAALELGWAPTDALDNRENVFHFEGTWYVPRPDHQSEDRVSLSWAGTRSENLASIWLLYHLLDRLEPSDFRKAAAAVGLGPGSEGDRQAWIRRVRDDFGVIAVDSRLPEVAWTAARLDVLRELDPSSDDAFELISLSYGRGAQTEEARTLKSSSGSTRARRVSALRANYLRYARLAEVCEPQAKALVELAAAGKESAGRGGWLPFLGGMFGGDEVVVPPAADFAALRVRPTKGHMNVGCGDMGEGWTEVGPGLLSTLAQGGPVTVSPVEEVRVERMRLGLLRQVERAASRRSLVLGGVDPYDFESLQYHPDFRTLIAMRTMARYARELGVEQELPPVLSMPLGAVDISLEEAATLYQGMVTGSRWTFPGKRTGSSAVPGIRGTGAVDSPDGPTLLIAEIRDREGNVIYRAQPKAEQVLSANTGPMVGDILRNVVRWGTGRRASGSITLAEGSVPVAGKTGTTNDYRNAAFSGVVPRASKEGWSVAEGYALAVYVGYDDNRPMRRGGIKLQGASGALPVWMGVAQGLADHGLLGETLPAEPEWVQPRGLSRVAVGPLDGLPTTDEALAEGRTVLFVGSLSDEGPQVRRHVDPLDADGAPLLEVVPVDPGTTGGDSDDDGGGGEEDDLDEVWIDEMDDGGGDDGAGGGGPGDFVPLPIVLEPVDPWELEPEPEPVEEPGEVPDGGGDSGIVPRIVPG